MAEPPSSSAGGSDRPRPALLDRTISESLGLQDLLGPEGPLQEDVGLRFYVDVLGLRHLHYGLWEAEDPLSLEGLRRAQERYLERLLSLIPSGVRRVLDVGSGAGGNAQVLGEHGYEVEGVSPDPFHGELFRAATGRPLHLARFEDFQTDEPFDLVLMSESAQYVPLERLFPAIGGAVAEGGLLLLSDYFTLVKDDSRALKSGHLLSEFRAAAAASGFTLEHEEDITEQVLPTLDLACRMLDEYVVPTARLVLVRASQKRPRLLRMALRLLGKRLARLEGKKGTLDRDLFREKKRYLICRYRAPG